MSLRHLPIGLAFLAAGSVHAAPGEPEPSAATPPDAVPDVAKDTSVPAPRALITPWLDIGFGLPTGFLGLSLEGRYGPVSLEAGAGFGFGGWQAMVQAWGHLFPTDSPASFALGLGWSTGGVQSKGDLGGIAGPDHRYAQAHWLNILVAPSFRAMGPGGPAVRLDVGAMLNLDPDSDDHARTLFIFGLSIGWEVVP